jgi:hypothetical protein
MMVSRAIEEREHLVVSKKITKCGERERED